MPTDWYTILAVLFLAGFAVFLFRRLRPSSRSREREFDTAIESPPHVVGYDDWHSLTPRQQQVARLAARGLSSSEIAQQLGVKPNTIDAHLKKIYFLLQVHSRAELSYRISDYID
ncbi:MAG TPA: helix-turn-helix transcriptional regulator [Anaerolineae bacterium]